MKLNSCADCAHVSKPELNIGYYHCRMIQEINPVMGEVGYGLCMYQNSDGCCPLFAVKEFHVRFTHSKEAFRWPPEPLIKKLKRILGIKPKGNPFVKLEDVK